MHSATSSPCPNRRRRSSAALVSVSCVLALSPLRRLRAEAGARSASTLAAPRADTPTCPRGFARTPRSSRGTCRRGKPQPAPNPRQLRRCLCDRVYDGSPGPATPLDGGLRPSKLVYLIRAVRRERAPGLTEGGRNRVRSSFVPSRAGCVCSCPAGSLVWRFRRRGRRGRRALPAARHDAARSKCLPTQLGTRARRGGT